MYYRLPIKQREHRLVLASQKQQRRGRSEERAHTKEHGHAGEMRPPRASCPISSACRFEHTASHVNPPGEPTFEAFDYLAKRLAQRGSGVRLRAFPRGQLGDEKDIIEH